MTKIKNTGADGAIIHDAVKEMRCGVPPFSESLSEASPVACHFGDDGAGNVLDVLDDGPGFDVVEDLGCVGDGGFGFTEQLGW